MYAVRWLKLMVAQLMMLGALFVIAEVAKADWQGPTNLYHQPDYYGSGYTYMKDPGPGTWDWGVATDDARIDGNGDRWSTSAPDGGRLYKNGVDVTNILLLAADEYFGGLAGVTGDYIYIKSYSLYGGVWENWCECFENKQKSYKIWRAALGNTNAWIHVLDTNLDADVAVNDKAAYYNSISGKVIVADLAAMTSTEYSVDSGGYLNTNCYAPPRNEVNLSRDGKKILLVKYFNKGSRYCSGTDDAVQQIFQLDGAKMTYARSFTYFTSMISDYYGEYWFKDFKRYSEYIANYYMPSNERWNYGSTLVRGSSHNILGIGRNSNRGYIRNSSEGGNCYYYYGGSNGPCGQEYYYYTWLFRPIPPIKVKASISGSSISLSWPAVAEATSYNIYKNGNYWTTVTSPGYTDPAAGSDYRVTSVNSAGESDAAVVSINVPPVVEMVSPLAEQKLGSINATLVPTVKVTDSGGDAITLTYFIDSETAPRDTKVISNAATAQVASFAQVNISGLTEGRHTLIVNANDGLNNIQQSVSFIIDRTPPELGNVSVTSTDSAIELTGAASDAVSGLDAAPYRYTVGADMSAWTANASYMKSGLAPNTTYVTRLEARDSLGQAAVREQQVVTKAQVPGIAVGRRTDTSLEWVLSDNNPPHTQYALVTGGQYVSPAGRLTASVQWLTLSSKSIHLTGLSANTSYGFQVIARNSAGIDTAWSQPISFITLPGIPEQLTSEAAQRTVRIVWKQVPGVAYDLEVDGVMYDQGVSTPFIHNGLVPETQHTYRVRGKNSGGSGEWSPLITVNTLPDPPPTPGSVSTTATQTEVTVSWDVTPKTTAYELEVDGTIIYNGGTAGFIHKGLQPLTEHSYRIRAVNSGGTSPWSETMTHKTLPYPPDAPQQVSGKPLIQQVTLTWEAAEGADAYEVEADGLIVENGNATTYVHEGLFPLTDHTYRVRAKNAGGKSPWSERLPITTHPEKPITPGNVMITSSETANQVMWYKVPHADSYEVEVDGTAVVHVAGIQFSHESLSPDSQHTYRVRAKNISGDSPWSRAVTMVTLPAGSEANVSLTNIVALVTNRYMTLSWDTVAPQAQYEIEVDGNLLDNGKDTIYHHTGLEPDEFHTYKIRLKKESGSADWISVLSLSTLPNPPDAPAAVDAFATNQSIELRWQRITGSDGYEVEVDGQTIPVRENGYVHTPLAPGTAHTYRVRARNMTGVTAWSPAITKSTTRPSYQIQARKDGTFELSLLASNVQDFSEVTFVVAYDPQQLEVVDLYTFTPLADTSVTGKIPGSNLEATYTPGKISYRIKQNMVPGTSWSGEVATVLFKSKVTAEVIMDVTVESNKVEPNSRAKQ